MKRRRFFSKKRILIFVGVMLLFLVGLEIFLRGYYGFCDTVLMQESKDFEYIAQPNQHRFRFRNTVIYNSLSMRSEEVDTSAIEILGFGDSVINGGVLTDQDSLATTILSKELTRRYNTKVQFLNISAGSWGPDNCFAYQKKYQIPASIVYLVVSSHDAYDNMTFEPTVGVHESYPKKQYPLAIFELIDRYVYPRVRSLLGKNATSGEDYLGINKQTSTTPFNPGFLSFYEYTTGKNIPFVIYLHADMTELQEHSFNNQGKQILQFANDHKIPIITDLDNNLDVTEFRDGIHINPKGQRMLAKRILDNFAFPDSLFTNKRNR